MPSIHLLSRVRHALSEQLVDEVSRQTLPNGSRSSKVAVPTRERVAKYQAERHVVEHLVGELNGRFGTVGNPMVHYLHSSMDTSELVARYRAADVMVVTPWRDGMNLVAKEFVASRPDVRMNPSSQQLRMQRLRRRVNAWDLDRWATSFLNDLGRRHSDATTVAG